MKPIPGSNLVARILQVTPAVAKQMLARGHPQNRSISASRVRRLAQAMAAREWTIAQPLMFNCDGTLIDGHHRLHAVLQAQASVDFLVVEGFDRERTFGVIDDTQPRRLAHWLQMRGENDPEALAAVIFMVGRDEAGLVPNAYGGAFVMTAPEGLDFLEARPEIRTAVVGCPTKVNILLSRAQTCFAYYKFCQKDPILAKEFLIELVVGDSAGEGDPIYLLRERLRRNRQSKQKLSRPEMLALVFKTWNAVRRGEKMHRLAWHTAGSNAEKFPEVI